MSETVHYKGVATKIEQTNDKTLIDVATDILKERNKKIDKYYDNAIECLIDEFPDEYFYYIETQTLYNITRTSYDLDAEIIKAKLNSDNSIEYELKYYNGGGSFVECLEEAFNKLYKT